MTDQSEIASFFSARAARYDRNYDARTADGHALRARMQAVLRLLGPGPGDVLDAGMGPGRLCAELARIGWIVSGIDASSEMVAAAHQRLPAARERLREGEVEALPFPDETFDAVAATGVLEYVDVSRALPELARVLRPGGRAVLSYPNQGSVYGLWKTRVFYRLVRVVKRALGLPVVSVVRAPENVSPERFEALLAKTGLAVETVEYTSFLPLLSPIDIMLPRAAVRLGEGLEGSSYRWRRLATQRVFATRKLEVRGRHDETARAFATSQGVEIPDDQENG
jgi:ubiquinone/menaquinone biosynthesis C-methylase UbiE